MNLPPIKIIGLAPNKDHAAIAEALSFNCTLNYLGLDCNASGDLGAEALGESLQINNVLKELYFMNNGIHKTSLAAFGKAFQTNCTLTHLTLAKLERLLDLHTAIKCSC